MTKFKYLLFLIYLVLFTTSVYAMAPTVQVEGHWESVNPFFIVQATIDGKSERVRLPKLTFKTEVDSDELYQKICENITSQDAVFNLYHNGLGIPEKKNGFYYASDVYLKDLDLTFTGYLRRIGYKFSLPKTPNFDEVEEIDVNALTAKDIEKVKEAKKVEKEAQKKANQIAALRSATVLDVLPKTVLPPKIRNEQAKVAAIVANLKKRPYKTEVIQMDPLRWASGYMGTLKENGEIDMVKCESQIVDMVIRVPDKKGWLTPKMLEEIKNTPCEFVLARYKNGLEVVEGTRYLLHDIYFTRLKLSWEEWLEKHELKCSEYIEKPEYASGVIPIEIHRVEGVFKSLDALSICQINFTEKSKLVYPQEIMRVFSPKPRPDKKQIYKFLKSYTDAYSGKKVDVHLMVCPDGKSYTELGQKRIKRMFFIENSAPFDETEQKIISNMNN